jgi:hypothetical protein
VRNPFKIENLFALNHNIPGYGTLDHFMMTHEWARVAGRAVATFFAGWFGPWAAPGANALITGYEVWLAGGSSQDIHKAAAISFATSMAFNFVGRGADAMTGAGYSSAAVGAFKIVGHAAVGCASAEASEGTCGQGALSAGFGAATTFATNGNFLATVVAGGVGAELGGGKFANGALTASMGYIMNHGFSIAVRLGAAAMRLASSRLYVTATELVAAEVGLATPAGQALVTKGFSSFDAFKRAFGGVGQDRAWHHVVEQHADNVTRFGAGSIHTASNMVNIDASLHNKITAYYNSNLTPTGGTVRDYVKTLSFDSQRHFGNEVLRQVADPY